MDATFHHIAISVRNMASMVQFYCDLLGFTVDWDMDHRCGEGLSTVVGMPEAEAHMVMLKGFGMRIELFHYYQPCGSEPLSKRQCDFGLTHFALQVQGIHNIYERLVSAGVRFNSPPKNLRASVWATYMRDPEENTIELVQYGD
jgi:catechol 2,3-dioxygenase-like lactoylglutathione lyase family enzyme